MWSFIQPDPFLDHYTPITVFTAGYFSENNKSLKNRGGRGRVLEGSLIEKFTKYLNSA